MRVRCVTNLGSQLPESYLDPDAGFTRDRIFPVSTGAEYVVYALTVRRGHVWYYLIDERKLPYPVWHPGWLFDVADGRLSRHWVFAVRRRGVRDGDVVFAFPEWAQDPLVYYDQLSDREPAAQRVFEKYRSLMDLEFAAGMDPLAETLGDGWMMCPECRETWQTTAVGEVLRCPKCGKALLNPRLERSVHDDVGRREPNL